MKIAALQTVDSAVLHEQYKPIDMNSVLEGCKTLCSKIGFEADVFLSEESNQEHLQIHVGGHKIVIRQEDKPLDPEGFRSALGTTYTGMIFPNAREAVESHTAYTFISISKGLFDFPEEISTLLGPQLSATNSYTQSDDVKRVMNLCRELVDLIIDNNLASAIHWCPSDNLVSPAFFQKQSTGDMTLLNLRPVLTSSFGRMGDGEPIGMTLNGSQWLIGKLVIFEETPVPFAWMMHVAFAFVKMCQARGSLIEDNGTFEVDGENWSIGVSYDESNAHSECGNIRLSVLKAAEFGIIAEPEAQVSLYKETKSLADVGGTNEQVAPAAHVILEQVAVAQNTEEKTVQVTTSEDREVENVQEVLVEASDSLNPKDEYDAAIMVRLQKHQEEEAKKASETEQEIKKPKKIEQWTEPTKRADIEDLRKIAKRANEEFESDKNSKGSVMGRFSGLFSRKKA